MPCTDTDRDPSHTTLFESYSFRAYSIHRLVLSFFVSSPLPSVPAFYCRSTCRPKAIDRYLSRVIYPDQMPQGTITVARE